MTAVIPAGAVRPGGSFPSLSSPFTGGWFTWLGGDAALADPPGAPRQRWGGGAAGEPHYVSTKATTAGRGGARAPRPGGERGAERGAGRERGAKHGAGRERRAAGEPRAKRGAGKAPGRVPGAVPPALPPREPGKPWTAPSLDKPGFDPATSKKVPGRSGERTEVYENADGTFTKRLYNTPVNYRDPSGAYRPIDTNLVRRGAWWRMAANSIGVSVAAQSAPSAVGLAPAEVSP
ncbi:MAG TPA: hypothetical protein VNV66_01925, partial [Pilimelia sp.]|nr:hypothetical protein [Pilimelia sp.]